MCDGSAGPKGQRKVGIFAPSSYIIPSHPLWHAAANNKFRYVARLSSFKPPCHFQPCTPPETPCPSSIRPLPGATRPFPLRRPLRVPSFPVRLHPAPTVLAEPEQNRTVATDSIRFPPPNFFFWQPSPLSPAEPSHPVRRLSQTRLSPRHATHPPHLFGHALVGAQILPGRTLPNSNNTCRARQNPLPGSNVHRIPGTSILETVELSASGSSASSHTIPLYFDLLTRPYDLQPVIRLHVLRDPVAAGI